MHIKMNGFVGGAVLLLPTIRKLREIVEFEKFQARILIDDERTREFKEKTERLSDKLYSMRYNNPVTNRLTVAGRKNDT